MKIGIITYHFSIGYGPVLQVYALQRYLQEKGHDVIILNYINNKQEANNSLFHNKKGIKNLIYNIVLLPLILKRIKKQKKFKHFSNEKLNCSPRFKSTEELERYINENNFDYIISGSDQVWNPSIHDFSEAFFLPISIGAKKITYAASIGNASLNDIKKYKEYIADFDKISLREKETVNIIKKIAKKDISVVVDPVALLDKADWEQLCKKRSIKKDYLLCYFIHKKYLNTEYKIAKKIAKDKNLKVIIINANYSKKSYQTNCIKDVGIEDFLTLFKNANYICTDSFHGTMFSIILEKDFSVFASYQEKKDTRRQNVLENVGKLDRLIYVEDKLTKINTNKVEYEKISKKFNENIELSKKYLDNI